MPGTHNIDTSLSGRIDDQRRHALACGALQTVETESLVITDHGVDFSVRVLSSLERKAAARVEETAGRARGRKPRNPFLPYDPNLYVTDVGSTHVCLLNKFNVLDRHILLVTRHFEDQEQLLNRADFEALWQCLDSLDWLAFYNGGRMAGASQPHKHLQIVPPGIGSTEGTVPIEAIIPFSKAGYGSSLETFLPFRHTLFALDPTNRGAQAATAALDAYQKGLARLDLSEAGDSRQAAPYNLLLTRRWLLLAPRRRECYESVSVNALGFAGSLLVRNTQQSERVRSVGPMNMLKCVGAPS